MNVPEAHNQIFNVGADVPYTVNELASIVSEAMGEECKVIHLDARNEVKVAFSDHSKVQKTFNRTPAVSLRDGVAAMVEWVKSHGARESSTFDEIEVPRNMPASWARVRKQVSV